MTSFLFRANPVATVYGGSIFWPLDGAAEAAHGLLHLKHAERLPSHLSAQVIPLRMP